MGKRYHAKIKSRLYEGFETISIGRYCSDGKFHFHFNNRIGHIGSPISAWRRFVNQENAQVIDNEFNEIEREKFFHEVETNGAAEEYLITSLDFLNN